MTKSKTSVTSVCPPKAKLKDRGLVSRSVAKDTASLFKLLSNDTRVRLLHALAIHNELCVSDLASQLKMKPQAISNQLQKLVAGKMLASRREGNLIFYRIIDRCVPSLLDLGLCLLEDSKNNP